MFLQCLQCGRPEGRKLWKTKESSLQLVVVVEIACLGAYAITPGT